MASQTAAYIKSTLLAVGQAIGAITPLRMQDIADTFVPWEDPANASGLGVFAIFRGAVYAHLVTGVTRGAGQTLGVRQATATALNAAILYAGNNNLEFKIADGIYEFDNTAGIVVSPNFSSFRWTGSNDVTLRQFHSNVPIISIGSMTNTSTDTLYGYIIDGFTVQYGITQTGQTAATGIRIGAGQVGWCSFRNITYNDSSGFKAYDGFTTTAGSTYAGNLFNCEFSNIKVQGFQNNGIKHGLMGEGNNWYNLFISNPVAGAMGAITGTAFDISSPFFAGGGSESLNGVHIDFIAAAGQIMNFGSVESIVINTLHIEECMGASQLASCTNLVINGCRYLNMNNLAATGGNATTPFWYLYDRVSMVVNGMTITWGGSGFVDTNYLMIFQDQTATDDQPSVVVNGLAINDAATGRAQANRLLALDRTVTTWVPPEFISRYTFGSAISRIEGALWGSVTTTRTIYGQFKHCYLAVPAALAGTITITLSNLARSGSGLPCETGNTIHILRQAGTATNSLTVNNVATIIGTANTTANVNLYYMYNAVGNWVAYTP